MNVHTTTCTIEHLHALQSVSKETFYETFKNQNSEQNMETYLATAFSEETLTDELSNSNSTFYLLYVDENLAGYLKLNTEDAQTENMGNEALEIERIYVLGSFQKMGLGKVLMNHAINIAKQQHKNKVWLGVWEKNVNAIAFYEKSDFVKTSSHSFMMGDEEQHDFIMMKTL